MTDVLKISDDEMATIFARELYVMVRGGYGRMTDAAVRHGWYVGLAEESRAAWRERADRLLASLARSEVVLAPAAIKARVRAELAEEIATAIESNDGAVYAWEAANIARSFAAGSSPDTTPERCDSIYEGWRCELTPPHDRHTAGDGGALNGATWTIGNEPRTTPEAKP